MFSISILPTNFNPFTIWIFASVCHQCWGNDAKRLFEDLLGNYNKLARPVIQDADDVKIQFKLKLLQILDVHEKKQIVATNGWLIHIWNDYRLQWNPRDYGNVTVMHIPAELIWLPDIILYNNADGSPQVTTFTKAHVYFSGRIVWEPPVIYNSMCEIQIQWFPLDEQFCKMKFGSWTYYGSQLNMVHLSTDEVVEMEEGGERVWTVALGIDIAEYQESVEWDLMSVVGTRHEKWYPCCDYPYVDMTYYINIRRKTLFYTVNLIIPCVGITILTCLVFYLPSDSNNKISLSVSVLVSLTVFFLLLIDIIPPTSLAIPLIGRYLMFTMILVSFSVCITVFIVKLHYSGDILLMPHWVQQLFLRMLPPLLLMPPLDILGMRNSTKISKQGCIPKKHSFEATKDQAFKSAFARRAMKRYDEDKIADASGKFSTATHLVTGMHPTHHSVLQAFLNVAYIAHQMRQLEMRENMKDDWKYVAMVLDRIFFILFSVTIFIGTGLIIASAPSVWDSRQPITALFP